MAADCGLHIAVGKLNCTAARRAVPSVALLVLTALRQALMSIVFCVVDIVYT
jgi:hypothetical protein